MQLDPAPWPGEPFPHELGMMIARVVEKDMDEHEHRSFVQSRASPGSAPSSRRAARHGLDAPRPRTPPLRCPSRNSTAIVALDECLLLLFVELARNDVRLVILEPQTTQKRDQSRAAFINEPEFRLDPGADLARRTRQCRAYPRLQIVLLLHTQIACAPAHIEA